MARTYFCRLLEQALLQALIGLALWLITSVVLPTIDWPVPVAVAAAGSAAGAVILRNHTLGPSQAPEPLSVPVSELARVWVAWYLFFSLTLVIIPRQPWLGLGLVAAVILLTVLARLRRRTPLPVPSIRVFHDAAPDTWEPPELTANDRLIEATMTRADGSIERLVLILKHGEHLEGYSHPIVATAGCRLNASLGPDQDFDSRQL